MCKKDKSSRFLTLLLGLELGYTKHYCIICEWGSRDKKNPLYVETMVLKSITCIGQINVIYQPLIEHSKIYLPPLKIRFIDSQQDFLPQNLDTMIDEHGERFQQDIS